MMMLNLFLVMVLGVGLVQVKRLLRKQQSPAHAASVMVSLLLVLFVSMLL